MIFSDNAEGSIYKRPGFFEKRGNETVGHKHNFDHDTFILKGAIRIDELEPLNFDRKANRPTKFRTIRSVEKRAEAMQCWVLIKAGTWHRLTALEDNSHYVCVYAHRLPSGEVVDFYDGWSHSYD